MIYVFGTTKKTQEYLKNQKWLKVVDFENFLNDFSMIDHDQKLFEKRPDTKRISYQILSLSAFTYKINNGNSILETGKR